MKRAIHIILLSLVLTAFTSYGQIALNSVVIDPGHGGKDPGCVSPDKKNYEKTMTLDISVRLAEKMRKAYPDLKVALTRTKDKFVSLDDRAEFANRKNADLFISIHINAARSTGPNGYSLHLLGQSSNKNKDLYAYNMDVCQRENSVILLEGDYSTKHEGFDPSDPESYIFMVLMQNSNLEQSLKFAETAGNCLAGGPIKSNRGIWQNPFYVLWKTSMPAVLIELGFMSNSSDLSVLRQPANREDLAERIFQAFKEYKSHYDRTLTVNAIPSSVAPSGGKLYGTQIIASSKTIPENSPVFLGYEPYKVKAGGLTKYIVGVSSSKEEAMKMYREIKKKNSECFFVEFEN